MKTSCPAVFYVCALALLCVFGCSGTAISPDEEETQHDSPMTISFTLKPAIDAGIDIYEVQVVIRKHTFMDTMSLNIIGEMATGTFRNLQPGVYSIEVRAFAATGAVYTGTGEAEVRPGQTTRAVIYIDFGTGNLEVIVVWGRTCYPDLPDPYLIALPPEYPDSFYYVVKYRLRIDNWFEYPDELFVPVTDNPAGESVIEPSRTWVHVRTSGGHPLNEFTDISSAEELQELWFLIVGMMPVPDSVYVTLWDRYCDITYTSNMVATAYDSICVR